jgi:hypothetical protein
MNMFNTIAVKLRDALIKSRRVWSATLALFVTVMIVLLTPPVQAQRTGSAQSSERTSSERFQNESTSSQETISDVDQHTKLTDRTRASVSSQFKENASPQTDSESPKTDSASSPKARDASDNTRLDERKDITSNAEFDKRIGPQNVTPTSLVTGENKTGVSAQTISVPSGPGTIEGMGESFSTQTSTGVAGFSIPIALPAARGIAQPSLGIGYSSASGSGLLGIGWSMVVGFIARQTDRGIPRYDDRSAWHPNQDRFVFNGGQELVPVTQLLPGEELPVWADASWQYFRPRVEGSYQRFFWNRAQRLWRVQSKSGVIAEFGVVQGETDAIETAPGESQRVFTWNLKRQIDSYGNEVRYYYDLRDGNIAYLTDILYTKPAGVTGSVGRDAWAYHVKLSYELRQDQTSSYRRGWETQQRYRLASVEVLGKDNASDTSRRRIRKYNFSYISGSHTLLLASMQIEGRCAEEQLGERCTLPPMRFGTRT